MHLIGVMADTHDNLDAVKRAISVFNSLEVSLVVHAGDFMSLRVVDLLRELKTDFIGVFGNNDGAELRARSVGFKIVRPPYFFDFSGRRVVAIHEPVMLDSFLETGGIDIIIYGHTHSPVIERRGGVLIVNPGATGSCAVGKATVGIIDAEALRAEIISM